MKHIRFIDGILRDYTAGEADPEKSDAAPGEAGFRPEPRRSVPAGI